MFMGAKDKTAITLAIIAIIFIVSFALRLALAYVTINKGINSNMLDLISQFKGLSPSTQLQIYRNLEAYNDFKVLYIPWLGLLSKGVAPYVGNNYMVSGGTSLHYPPLFLYSLLPFYAIGGQLPAAMLIIFADSLSAVFVYLIATVLSKDMKTSLLAGFAYALLPFALVYEGISLLNIEPMLVLVLASLYLMHKKKLLSSAIVMAFAVGMRQEALFIVPIYALTLFDGSDRNKSGLALSAFAFFAVLLAMSAPFLLSNAQSYISALIYANNNSPPSIGQDYISSSVHISPLFILVPLSLASLLLLISLRKKFGDARYEYFGAILIIILVIAFGLWNMVSKYYFLPVYAMLLASSKKWQMIATSFSVSTASLFLQSGWIQELLPMLVLLALALMYMKKE